MWSVSHLCRCTQSLRAAQNKLLITGSRSGFNNTNVVSRQLITTVKNYKGNNYKGFRLSNIIKTNGILARFCATAPKSDKTSKVVGYWLLGCSGMVFTAVVLGMVAGYLILLYSIYYVVNLVISTSNGSK